MCFFIACVTIYLSGVNEADGNERLVTLVGLVLQVLRFYADFGGNYDPVFPTKSRRRSSDHHVHRPEHHVRVSAAVRTFSYDILLHHLDILLKRYVVLSGWCGYKRQASLCKACIMGAN